MDGAQARKRALVLGASGNVGAAVVRHLVADGDDVRVLLRRSSSTRGIDGLDVDRRYGDIFDTEAVAAAMADRDVVFYCVVDTRAHLADPAPLFATNVEGLRGVLDIAARADLKRFVFLSTIGTIAVGADGVGDDEEIRAILDEADNQAAERVLEAIGFAGTGSARVTALAIVRAYGGMVKAAVREWVDHETLTQDQVREILSETLVVLAEQITR